MLKRIGKELSKVGSEVIREDTAEKIKNLYLSPEVPRNLSTAYLLSATYEGDKHAACLKLYEPESRKIYFWYDNTGHQPYCLSDAPIEELKKNGPLVSHQGFDHFERVTKFDALHDKEVEMTKIVAKDPRSIGGQPSGSIRDLIQKAWEARIKYYESYLYDKRLSVGIPYVIKDGELLPIEGGAPKKDLNRPEEFFKKEKKEFQAHINRWIKLLECPVPEFYRLALDIEVYSPVATRVPDPTTAKEAVIAVSLVDSDGNRRVLVLKRPSIHKGEATLPEDTNIEYYDREEDMLAEVFRALLTYPIVLTFNGDSFDLRYLFHRAENLGFPREPIPIILERVFALLKYGVHIDLYRFFLNRSIQVYAFSQKYKDTTLDGIAKSILNIGKIELEKPVSELTYTELANYCLRDAELTMQLTTFDDSLVMKLIIALARISQMPIEDVTREGVSRWIRSIMFFEHRGLNWLIPRPEDIEELKGVTTTKAVIDGKKYRGAIVIEPKSGVHFNVCVLDFSSLYPSIIKQWNLSYETVRCPHNECKDNKVPGTPHWVCKKRAGISSLVIGTLRDLRVNWYKSKSKDKNQPPAMRSWYNVIQQSLKVILNASYGVFGAEVFDLYCPPVAESTAAIGRYAITETVHKAEDLGIDVVYGDTDSIFLKNPTQPQINQLIEWSKKSIGMELDTDKVYRYSAFSSRKKNYLGVYLDGSVDIKGLTGKKRHTPIFLKKAFTEMIDILGRVKSPEDFDEAKDKIREIVKTCYFKLKNGNYALEDLAFNVMVGKPLASYVKTTPQHVKAAKLLAKKGIEVKPGEIISFVKTNTPEGVNPVQLASIKEIDAEKYMGYIKSTFEQVLDAIGIDFDEIAGFTKLESFLWTFEE